jgi:hypothetical protein
MSENSAYEKLAEYKEENEKNQAEIVAEIFGIEPQQFVNFRESVSQLARQAGALDADDRRTAFQHAVDYVITFTDRRPPTHNSGWRKLPGIKQLSALEARTIYKAARMTIGSQLDQDTKTNLESAVRTKDISILGETLIDQMSKQINNPPGREMFKNSSKKELEKLQPSTTSGK